MPDGLAAGDRGDHTTAVRLIVAPMPRLAELASADDSLKGSTLKGSTLGAMADRLAAEPEHGALRDAKAAAAVMRERSGSTVIRHWR